jgi:glutamine amidotransferase
MPVLHAALYKTIQPPINDANFRSISSATSTTCVLAHIRASSGSPVVSVNNHPFTFGRHAIMHNGFIASFHAIARQMANLMSDAAYAHIGGSTDTEHLAALYMTYLTSGISSTPDTLPWGFGGAWERQYTTLEMLTALRRTVNTVIDLQNALGDKIEPNDLNVCVTDGQQLVAIRFRNHPTEQPPSLYYSTTAGATFNRKYPDHPDGANGPFGPAGGSVEVAMGQGRGYDAPGHDPSACKHRGEYEFTKVGQGSGGKAPGRNPYAYKRPEEHGRHVIVASEPMTYNEREWTLIKKNHVVMVSGDDQVVVQEF